MINQIKINNLTPKKMQIQLSNIDCAPEEVQVEMPVADTRPSTLGKLLAMVTCFALITAMLTGLSSLVFAQSGPADIEVPSDVENVRATAGDSMVSLTWDVATDNVGVDGYKVYYGLEPVTAQGGNYQYTLEVGDVIEYDVKNLVNGTAYYFAVTAYDASGNESESYSLEVEATPQVAAVEEISEPLPMGDDGKAPTVKSAEGYSNVQVKVVFSEPVELPAEEPQTAFLIEDNLTGEFLPLLDAETMQSDKKIVIIETAPQDANSEYILTAGITVQDVYGNSVRSGTSDTATFLAGEGEYRSLNTGMVAENLGETVTDVAAGTLGDGLNDAADDLFGDLTEEEMAALEEALGEAVANGDITGGTILDESEFSNLYSATDGELPEGVASIEAVSETDVKVVFSEAVAFVEAENYFVVYEKDGELDAVTGEPVMMTVSSQELTLDGMTATFTVDAMKPGYDYVLSIMNVVTTAGVAIDSGEGIEFQAKTLELVDVIPPAEVTNFLARLEGSLVSLTWTVSVSEDAIEQIVYQSTDGVNYFEKVVLPPLVSEFEVSDLVAGMTYWFKVTSRDGAGNESAGVITEVTLPETGPGLALMFGLSALGTAFVSRRKKRSI